MLFAILKTKKLQANCNLRKIHKQFGQRNSGEQHKGRQRSDSAEPYADGFPKSTDQQSHVLTKNHLQCIRIQARFIGNSDNATTGEQHKGKKRSDFAEPDAIDIPKNTNPKRNTKIPLFSKSRGIFSISV